MRLKLFSIFLLSLTILFGFFYSKTVLAATFTLSGSVKDNSGGAIAGATVNVNSDSATTDNLGNYSLSVEGGTHNIQVTPPSGSGFGSATAPNYTVSSNTFLNFILVQSGSVTLSGHVYGPQGNALPHQLVYLETSGTQTTTYTDSSGAYFLQVAPGAYAFHVDMTPGVTSGGNALSVNTPQYYSIFKPSYSLAETIITDITIPAKRVGVHVKDGNNNPIGDVLITTSPSYSAAINWEQLNIGGNITNAIGGSSYAASPGVRTDSSGNVTLWLLPTDSSSTYSFIATPPSESGLPITTLSNISISGDTQKTITLVAPVTLSGHVYGPQGNPLPQQLVYLETSGGVQTSTHTNLQGVYSLQVVPGTYSLYVQMTPADGGNTPSLNAPQYYILYTPSYSLTQNTSLDITLPAKKVDVHVQNAEGDPVSNVRIITSPSYAQSSNFGGLSMGGGIIDGIGGSSYATSPETLTDSSGDVTLWLFPNDSSTTYTFVAVPPAGSIYSALTLENISVTENQTELISLQYNHATPITVATLSPEPNSQGQYQDPVTVTLSTTAAFGYTIANTYYTIDGDSQQTYSAPFNVSGDENHTITFWSVDNVGVSEEPNSETFTIFSHKLTSLSPAKIWVGLKNSDDAGIKFDFKVEAYKNGDIVSSGQVNSFYGGSSGFNNARLATINFNSFAPVDFPTGSELELKVYVRNACVGSGKNSGNARLWFNDSSANSQFGTTIAENLSDYFLQDLLVLAATVGPGPKKTIDIQSGAKCSSFKSFGTWKITP